MTDAAPFADRASDEISIQELVERLLRRKWTIVLWSTIGIALGAAFLLAMRPTYRATATILLERDRGAGTLGDLAALATMASAPSAASEISVLTSNALLEQVIAFPDTNGSGATAVPTPDTPGYRRHVGLTTRVTDLGLTTLRYVRQKLFTDDPFRLPTTPAHRVFARASSAGGPDSTGATGATGATGNGPRKILVEFLAGDRVRVSTKTLFGETEVQELAFRAGAPLEYRGVRLDLVVEGDPTGSTFLVERVPEYRALEDLAKSVTVNETARNSGVLEVGAVAHDPRAAREIVDALCENYLRELNERKSARANETVAFIQSLIEDEQESFEETRRELLRIQEASPEALALDVSAAMLVERIAEVHSGVMRAELERQSMSSLLRSLNDGDADALARLDAAITNRLVVDPTTETMLLQIAALLAEHGRESARFQDDYPPLADLSAGIETITAAIGNRLEERLRGIEETVEQLRAEEDSLRREFGRLPAAAHTLGGPMLALEVHQRVLPELLTGLRTAEITREASKLTARIVDGARVPFRLHSPSITLTAVLSLLLGGAFGVLRALWTEPRRGSILTAAELARATESTALGVVPRLAQTAERAGRDPRGRGAEVYRRVRAALRLERDGVRSLGLTATRTNEGCSTTVAGLAHALAREGRKVLVIDADLGGDARGARAAELLAIPVDAQRPGLGQVLGSKAAWKDAVARNTAGGPDVIAPGADVEDPHGLLAGDALARTVGEALEEYELVLVDLPAAGENASTLRIADRLDGVVLVHAAGRARRRDVAGVASDLERAGARLLGTVLTRARRV